MSLNQMSSRSLIDLAKENAGKKAAEFVCEGMRVGLGTGSTAAHFIKALGIRCAAGLRIQAVATSIQSTQLASEYGIPLANPDSLFEFDITVDGADEIDPQFNMIKGGGGALLREKLLAQASREVIIIADASKLVTRLGKFPLPLEVIPFLYPSTFQKIRKLGYEGRLRITSDKSPFVTDNGNYICDLSINDPITHPHLLHEELKRISGVVETGLFFNLVKRVIVGYENGTINILTKE